MLQKNGFKEIYRDCLIALVVALCSMCSAQRRHAHEQETLRGQSAVTYEFSGGRFGDNLLAYMHAKWISYKFGLPLLYRPFPLSEQLVLHVAEQRYTYQLGKAFKAIVLWRNNKGRRFRRSANTLHEIPYFPHDVQKEPEPHYSSFFIDWHDKEFKNELKRVIQPRFPLPEISLPADRITVAIHIRRGGSFEKLNLGAPHKFPDDSYYLEQLEVLDELLQQKPLYVFLFTDDREPLKILQKFQEKFEKFPRIFFDCRKAENDHNMNVIEDFFALTKFDCLIRPDSNFSICAAKISEYLVEIEPKTWSVIVNKSIVSKANVIIDQEACHRKGVATVKSNTKN